MENRANPAAMWDERYSQTEPVYGEQPNNYLRAQVHRLAPGAAVLVPGDGYGRNGLWLAQQGFRVHTVDLSPIGVERARNSARAAGLNVTIEQADLSTWAWPRDRFDAVFSIFVHLFPNVRSVIHASILRALVPGGICVLEAFAPGQLKFSSGGPKQVDLLYSAEILRQDFAAADILALEDATVLLNEGRMHNGPGAVVRGVFRKK
ncbi:MAG TPA: class I SAM-dependent methyltransferase [Candidatus Acidoferrum sp.]